MYVRKNNNHEHITLERALGTTVRGRRTAGTTVRRRRATRTTVRGRRATGTTMRWRRMTGMTMRRGRRNHFQSFKNNMLYVACCVFLRNASETSIVFSLLRTHGNSRKCHIMENRCCSQSLRGKRSFIVWQIAANIQRESLYSYGYRRREGRLP